MTRTPLPPRTGHAYFIFQRLGGLGHRARAFHAFEFKSYWPASDARSGAVVVSHRGTKRFPWRPWPRPGPGAASGW